MALRPRALRWRVLGLGAIVGVMSAVIPYSLELIALRRLPPETFAILTCLSPVVAAVAGWLILGQHLAVTGYVAIVLVTVASIGAVRSARERLAERDTRLITTQVACSRAAASPTAVINSGMAVCGPTG